MVFLDADTANIIKDAMRGLSYFLCEFIYELIVWMYKVFDRLCNSRILDSAALETIAERVGILLGLIMLFMVVFSVIQMVLEPDKLTDKEKGIGNILKKIILVMVMLGVSSSVFSLMYGIQKKVIASNVIQKFLLPYEVTGNESFGGVLSYNLFTSVYYYNVDNLNVEGSVESLELQHRSCYEGFNKIETRLKNGEKDPFAPIKTCVNAKSNDTYIMSFNWLLAPIIGGGVLYFIFSYCISIGIRTIQLAFLEIIAPMAIISYLSPKKDSMFSKWTKLYFATYIDVFLRIMIINLIAFLIMTILESSDKWVFWNSVGGKTGTFADKAIWILMVFALLTFAKKAPDLLKDLFPSSASKLGFGITSPKKMFDSMLGAKYIEGGFKRGWGAVRVGTGTAIGNIRRVAGKLKATAPNYNALKKENAALINGLNEAIESGDDVAEAIIRGQLAANSKELAKSRLERRKWMIRGFTGLAGGLAGGAMAGLGTKDKGSRDRQIKVKTDRAKSNWKLQDAGYGYKERLQDAGRQFLYMDTDVEQRADSTDAYISNLEMQINELVRDVQSKGKTIRNIQKAKVPGEGGDYVWYDNGVERRVNHSDLSPEEQKYVKLLEDKGKAKSNSSALHQRDNEKKDK